MRRPVVASRRPDELRIAAIDVGSNSLHMIVAQVDSCGGISVLWRMREMVGLGRISFPSKRLTKEAMGRAMMTLQRFLAEAHRWQCEDVIAIATSAVREAENGGEFIAEVRARLGVHVRVVSPRDEARLIYLGVRHGVDLRGGGSGGGGGGGGLTFIIDIGGGSVEFIVADAEKPLMLESRKLGSARMTARFVKSDPPEPREVKALTAHYRAEIEPILQQVRQLKPRRFIGTSGSILTLAAMTRRARDAASNDAAESLPPLERDRLERLVDTLLKSTSDERATMTGLDEKRKEQIIAPALLVREVLRELDVKQLEVSSSALREGVLVDYLARHRPELEIRRESPNPRRREVLDLGRRCHWHRDHGEQVARLTLRLFDLLRPLHRLGPRERDLIGYAALLHDVGATIGRVKHHKHSMYLIMHGELRSFSPDEVRTIANIARYHRKAPPSREHREYAVLPKLLRKTVRVGAALLRVADGLDRTNCSVVTELSCRTRPEQIELLVSSRGDAQLELWSANERRGLFEKVFKRTLLTRASA
jgi:exopolyphosphatase/guanosine-5'-triphosphate,3'-diphosphate pyrophosphatase